jgi:hypothetical protein
MENFYLKIKMGNRTFNSSENKIANTIRRSLFVELAHKDLPGFLVDEIEAILIWLNYFKISNLRENKKKFLSYVDLLIVNYHTAIRDIINWTNQWILLDDQTIEDYLTQELVDNNVQFTVTKKQLQMIKSSLAVQCTLQVKEFIYRQTTRTHTLKQTLA